MSRLNIIASLLVTWITLITIDLLKMISEFQNSIGDLHSGNQLTLVITFAVLQLRNSHLSISLSYCLIS